MKRPSQKRTVCSAIGLMAAVGVASTIAAVPPASDDAQTGAPKRAINSVDFQRDVYPILSQHCVRCHSEKKSSGGLLISDRETLLKGGDSGPAIVLGDSGNSLLIQLISGLDPDRVMPAKGERLPARQIKILRDWIDRGANWDKNEKYQLYLAEVRLPPGVGNPIDRLLAPYFLRHHIDPADTISDERFARRVALDIIGQPMGESQLTAFLTDRRPNKRDALVKRLLTDHENYVSHWMTFWSDHLRIGSDVAAGIFDNDETKGPQIWLKEELERDVPVDRLVHDLLASDSIDKYAKSVAPAGEVASRVDVPEMQLATTVSQVFLGIQLKCASCHDSFVDRWKMTDAWGLAAALSKEPFEIYRCDIATHQTAAPCFPLVELGAIDSRASVQTRRRQVADMITERENGLFARTIVNRIWQRLIGRGLVERLDEMMEHQPWNAELLDWLAGELVRQRYDLKGLLALIATSRAYQLPSVVPQNPVDSKSYVFRGPEIRRLTAEQFLDSLRELQIAQDSEDVATGQKLTPRAWQLENNRLMTMLGRPSRDVVTTSRNNEPTPLMALELINGDTLKDVVDLGASVQLKCAGGPTKSGGHIFKMLLGREPTGRERRLIANILGPAPTQETVSDLIWAVTMLPEFQLIQ